MSDWFFRYKTKIEVIVPLIKRLLEEKIEIPFVEVNVNDFQGNQEIIDLAKENKIPVEEIKVNKYLTGKINIGDLIGSFIHENIRVITITIYTGGDDIPEETIKTLQVVGEFFKDEDIEIIDENVGAEPIYKGKWDFEYFKKKIQPQIEWHKKP